MHCLFVSSLLPEGEPRTGFEIANRAILRAFEAAGARVTPVGFRRPGSAAPMPGAISLGDLAIENAGATKARKARWLARALVSGLPVAAAKLRVHAQDALAEKLRAAGPFDAIVLNSVQMPAAYPFLLDLAPTIFVAHNVEHVSAAENAREVGGRAARRLYVREAGLLERIEARICARADTVLTLSEADLAPLGLAGDAKAASLPLAVGRAVMLDDGLRRHDVGLIGTWSWAPNRAGLDWFLSAVAPLLPADVTVAIAGILDGKAPPAPRNVSFLGRVPDAQAFVASTRVLALATRGGTGVQLKTLETLEEGIPAVATSLALRGIDGPRPANLAVADDAPGFAAALVNAVRAERAGQLPRTDGRAFTAARQEAAVAVATWALERVARPASRREAVRAIGPLLVLAITREEAVARFTAALEGPGLTRLAFANAHCVNLARRDPAYRASLAGFDILADGFGLDIASRVLHGSPFPANLNGTDFVPHLLTSLPKPATVALVGGRPGVAERAAAALARLAPRHTYRAVSDGFFAPGAESDAVLERLRAAEADIVIVARGVPAQELFIGEHLTAAHGRLAIGVGALFDFLAGEVVRAPALVRRLRLEWGWRLAQEPRRLARRYIVGNPLFLADIVRDRLGRP